jgi:rare lipoprotein A
VTLAPPRRAPKRRLAGLARRGALFALVVVTGCASSPTGRGSRAPAAPLTSHDEAVGPAEPAVVEAGHASALAPGSSEGPAPKGKVYQRGLATYYADSLAGHRTAAGEPYDPGAFTAAHRTLPFGAVVDVARADGRHVTVRINDRGPFVRDRIIDLSRRAALAIGLVGDGVGRVDIRVVSLPRKKPRAKRR